mmetsp:Transcript_30783/g.73892  ORF Transcript_30783/g.73892 Transcript_30783/m.73892 type:complete len:406 (+) Transcript_30783:602-1819(+)|eukprot:CAMPEP_0113644524 /NCGR_PEP_ID=MMETSP0017_2-20120614/23436_1 /TAXON_ID=2856 /ORGANISM="Cylindrotheca closterium" /LENGTH=405 /DNA_ID=CAMNT_0000556145 /DNA_START=372 /DNA_END=1589 /DNA_ORIENTATION=+ /assembly_acc=CAM_ASM_000147
MDSLLERIEDNKLDALYLFINETLRDQNEFDRFFESLQTVLPLNWSIQRVEIGHQFLSMVSEQGKLFDLVASLEGLRTLIISDGYVPRKDRGSIDTEIFLDKMFKARNLQILDLQRLQLTSIEQVELLEDFLKLQESLEELRLTGLYVSPDITLDPAIEACCEMPHLRSLSLSAAKKGDSICAPQRDIPMIEDGLQELLQGSTTIQDLSLRSMHLKDEQCLTIAESLSGNSFLTSLDIRQNDDISKAGFAAILQALERNYSLWCSVLVDHDTYQAKFNSLIELNAANRGDLVRSPSKEKLINFFDALKDDPTALFHFFTIHESILHPTVKFLLWKYLKEHPKKATQTTTETTETKTTPRKRALEELTNGSSSSSAALPQGNESSSDAAAVNKKTRISTTTEGAQS